MSLREKQSSPRVVSVRALTMRETSSKDFKKGEEKEKDKEKFERDEYEEVPIQEETVYNPYEPRLVEESINFNYDLEAGNPPPEYRNPLSVPRRVFKVAKDVGSMFWIYALKQLHLTYSSGLLCSFMVTNPPIPLFVISMCLFCLKILFESNRDAKNRNVYDYSSRVSKDVGLTLFFFTIFGLIHTYKKQAGLIDNSEWFETWPFF